jgi:branched-chain amino acid transport system permease protein
MALTSEVVYAGISDGATYGLAAVGLTFVYRVTGMLNFSQGMLIGLTGLTYADLTVHMGVGYAAVIAVAGAILLSGGLGLALQRWFGRENEMVGALVTLGLSIVFQAAAALTFGVNPLSAPELFPVPNLHIGGGVVLGPEVLVIVAAVVISIAFWAWLGHTDQGRVFTALVDNPVGAHVVGFRITRLRVLAFMIGGLLAAVAAITITPADTMSYDTGQTLLLSALTASAVGGLSNPLAAVVGGVAVGLVENIVAAEVGSLWQVPVPLAVLMVVLIVRPQGLLTGRKARTV